MVNRRLLEIYVRCLRYLQNLSHHVSPNRKKTCSTSEDYALTLSTIESLAFAVEARTSQNIGHIARVQTMAEATAIQLGLSDHEIHGIRIAAMLHDVGRLGVPDNILAKEGDLTPDEREKVRAYPVLGSRLVSAIPFPWPVTDMIRHHREHFDGGGYPDGISGDQIPIGARILAVVDTFDVMTRRNPPKERISPEEVIEELRRLSGTQFDSVVVRAFEYALACCRLEVNQVDGQTPSRNTALEIAGAHREMQSLYAFACSAGSTIHLEETLELLTRRILGIMPASTCVIFLEEDGDYLHAYAATGANEQHFRQSVARKGTYLTGRVATRGQALIASFLPDDIQAPVVRDPWIPLRSTLIVPLKVDGQILGTVNLYQMGADAFDTDDLRMMALISELAARSINNALLFERTQETAFTDPVTGLRNRRFMRQFLEQEINRATKTGASLVVLGMDLDGFKMVNDTFGHDKGDEVLRDVAKILHSHVRNYDLVARYAGDEFAVVLSQTMPREAEGVALKILTAVEDYASRQRAVLPGFPYLSVSIGAAAFPQDAQNIQTLLSAADQVMYDNKRQRKAAKLAA